MLPSFLKKLVSRKLPIEIAEKAKDEIVFENKRTEVHKEELDLGLEPDIKNKQFIAFGIFGLLMVLLLIWPKKERLAPSDPEVVDLSPFNEKKGHIQQTIFLEDFLESLPLDKLEVDSLSKSAAALGLITLNLGNPIKQYYASEASSTLRYIVYEPKPSYYYLLSLSDPLGVQMVQRKAQQVYAAERWVLEADFLDLLSIEEESIPWKILQQIEPILSWSIGLRNLMKGDTIILVREHLAYDGEIEFSYDEKIVALSLQSRAIDTTILAFNFQADAAASFYDYDGRPWKRMFLKSPVKYARISSRYNLVRLHPIFKTVKPHFGNDFAAPMGEEVLALADGKIVNKEERGGNGNYIKIEHDEIYTTAYLHLSAYRDGLQVGDIVKQGEVIGYVGATGSATGPHVCLRFWRREFQDDFVKAFPYLPKPAPMPNKARRVFFEKRDTLMQIMLEVI